MNCACLFHKTCGYYYSRICLIRHCLIRQSVTFSAEILSFVYISVGLISHRLIRKFVQLVTFFYPREAFCSAHTSIAVSLLMFKQPV